MKILENGKNNLQRIGRSHQLDVPGIEHRFQLMPWKIDPGALISVFDRDLEI